jgi:predicted CoA-binding protein
MGSKDRERGRIPLITNDSVRTFLEGHRIALVGATDAEDSFARTIDRALVDHGYEVLPVNPRLADLDGRPCYPSVRDVPAPVDGAIIMVGSDHASKVVDDVAAAGVEQVWLFKGLGSQGAATPDAIEACERHGLQTVAGACPLMFLEPVGGGHRIHRAVRAWRGALERPA